MTTAAVKRTYHDYLHPWRCCSRHCPTTTSRDSTLRCQSVRSAAAAEDEEAHRPPAAADDAVDDESGCAGAGEAVTSTEGS